GDDFLNRHSALPNLTNSERPASRLTVRIALNVGADNIFGIRALNDCLSAPIAAVIASYLRREGQCRTNDSPRIDEPQHTVVRVRSWGDSCCRSLQTGTSPLYVRKVEHLVINVPNLNAGGMTRPTEPGCASHRDALHDREANLVTARPIDVGAPIGNKGLASNGSIGQGDRPAPGGVAPVVPIERHVRGEDVGNLRPFVQPPPRAVAELATNEPQDGGKLLCVGFCERAHPPFPMGARRNLGNPATPQGFSKVRVASVLNAEFRHQPKGHHHSKVAQICGHPYLTSDSLTVFQSTRPLTFASTGRLDSSSAAAMNARSDSRSSSGSARLSPVPIMRFEFADRSPTDLTPFSAASATLRPAFSTSLSSERRPSTNPCPV